MSHLPIAQHPAGMIECPMDTSTKPFDAQSALDFARIEKAIRYLTLHAEDQPDLNQIAREVGLSEYHFQRLFTRWAGISPKKFLQYLTLNLHHLFLAHATHLSDRRGEKYSITHYQE